ncbi:MAG: SufS family cysteine desulfurase [Oligoflexia bacterium]|nr:SufS family cysteine desulfurase [Oligoflexia bacterium]
MSSYPEEKEIQVLPQLGRAIRQQFPIFSKLGEDLAYLDTAASAQKCQVVLERLNEFLSFEYANVHRGAYGLSAAATEAYEAVRPKVARFINAADPHEIVFTHGTTESINLAAHAIEPLLAPGGALLVTLLEHHSNIVPWQLLAQRKQQKIDFVDVTDCGELNLSDLEQKLERHHPKLLAITAMSNALGTIVPLDQVVRMAHAHGTLVLVDAAQGVPHLGLDVTALDLDFAAFSGHKLYGPTGVGVFFGKAALLEKLDPFMSGGSMIRKVTTKGTTFADPPHRFEAGTPPIAEVVGLGAAIDFITGLGVERVHAHEAQVFRQIWTALEAEEGVTLHGPATAGRPQTGIISFNLRGVHPHDLSTILDRFKVQVRAGHHCAMPLLNRLGFESSARISLGCYSDLGDLDPLLSGIREARRIFR